MFTLLMPIALAGLWDHEPSDFEEGFEAAIVPGCPAHDDGQVSSCQWRRASWAAELYHAGAVQNLVVSGAAVYNPFVEAEGLALALEYLGVPSEHIVIEQDARHTDQNAAYSWALCGDRGWERLAVVSDGLHAVVIEKMIREWGGDAFAIPVTEYTVDPAPSLQLVAVAGWLTPEQVDAQRPRPSASLPMYVWRGLTSPLLRFEPPAR